MKNHFKPVDVYLQPGDYFVGDARHRISTLLGSCVSMTLWHPDRKIGAISHFLLSSRNQNSAASGLDARYGQEAMSLMLQELKLMGVNPTECEGKIFGGGDMFPDQARPGMTSVGQKNGESARSLLLSEGIQVVSESLFGVGHRQIIFDVISGDVWARQIKPFVPPFTRH